MEVVDADPLRSGRRPKIRENIIWREEPQLGGALIYNRSTDDLFFLSPRVLKLLQLCSGALKAEEIAQQVRPFMDESEARSTLLRLTFYDALEWQ